MNIAIDGRTVVKGKSGVGTYVERTMRALLKIDRRNNYFLFLVEPLNDLEAPNLTKVLIEGYQRAGKNRYWENFLLPRFAEEHKIDIFFGAAYALPLLPRWKSIGASRNLIWGRPAKRYALASRHDGLRRKHNLWRVWLLFWEASHPRDARSRFSNT